MSHNQPNPEPQHVATVWLVATDRTTGALTQSHIYVRRDDHRVDLPGHLTSPTLVLSGHCSCGEIDRDSVLVTTREPVSR